MGICRWGTEELFKEEEQQQPVTEGAEGQEGAGKKANEHEIVWDDGAVDALLDRNRETEGKVRNSTLFHMKRPFIKVYSTAKVNKICVFRNS